MFETLAAIEWITIISFMWAAVILYFTSCADMMFTFASGISGGSRVGVAAAIGISSGVLVHVGMTALGLAVLLLTYPMAYNIIRYLGGLYLLLLAVQSWWLCGDWCRKNWTYLVKR